MILLVSGGRTFSDYPHLCAILDEVATWAQDGQVSLVNGGANGADGLSTKWAIERGIKYVEVLADWAQYGKPAGPLRNAKMLADHKPDQAVVFPGGNGTADMLQRLFFAGVPTWVVGEKR